MEKNYTPKAKIKTIKAASRVSIKVKDNFYTLEYAEERVIPQTSAVNIQVEKELLWDEVNAQVDKQIEDVLKAFNK